MGLNGWHSEGPKKNIGYLSIYAHVEKKSSFYQILTIDESLSFGGRRADIQINNTV